MEDQDVLSHLIELSPYSKTCIKIKKAILETILLNHQLNEAFNRYKLNRDDKEALNKLLYFIEFTYFTSDDFLNDSLK